VKEARPPLHTAPVATVTLPLSATLALFTQTLASAPALAVGAGVKANVMLSDTAMQLLLPVVVRVRINEPLEISVEVGVYVAFILPALGLKVPLRPLHTAPVATVKLPARVAVALFAQRLWSGPAFTVGAGVMVYVTWSLTALQRPLPALVSVRVTVPAARSAALGVYAALGAVLLGLYVPLPPLQIAPVAPLTVPLKVMAALLAHTVPLGPASTKGAGVKV